MTVTSLLESAQTFRDVGREFDAEFACRMAADAMALNQQCFGTGDAFYRHFASQMAERAARFQRDSNREGARDAGNSRAAQQAAGDYHG